MIRAVGLLAIALALAGCGSNHQAGSSSQAVTQCTVSLVGHDARVEFVATDAAKACDDFARTHSTSLDEYWTTKPSGRLPTADVVVCDAIAPEGGEAIVYDSGLTIYGRPVCNALVANGWRLRGT